MKKCGSCKIEKPLDNFGKLKSSPDGYRTTCRECRKVHSKNYRENNKEKLKEAQKKWVEQNPDKSKELKRASAKKRYTKNPEKYRKKQKNWRTNNREKFNAQMNQYQLKRRKKDPIFKMKQIIRSRINRFHSSDKRTEQILGCSYDFFKSYIEEKFVDGMNWDNQGEWHYDHIKPISLAKTEEEVLLLSHYTNFQPLWAKDNLKKSNKILTEYE